MMAPVVVVDDTTFVRRRRHSLGSSSSITMGQDIEEAAAGHETPKTSSTSNNNNSKANNSNNKKGDSRRRQSLTPALAIPVLDKPPISRGVSGQLPLTMAKGQQNSNTPEPRLLHPALTKISVTTRFAVNGLLSNMLFMLVYNWSIENIPEIAPPTMYSIVYLIFIPIGHAMVSLLVFGWPEKYCPSLMSNFPIGLTAIGIGGGLTAWLDSIEFNEKVADYMRNNFEHSSMPSGDEGQFYSSLAVLVVTSLWTYVLSIYVNSPPDMSEKKEL